MKFEVEIKQQMASIDSLVEGIGGLSIKGLLQGDDGQKSLQPVILVLDAETSVSIAHKNGVGVHYMTEAPSVNDLLNVYVLGVYSEVPIKTTVRKALEDNMSSVKEVLDAFSRLSVGCLILAAPIDLYTLPNKAADAIASLDYKTSCMYWGQRVGKSHAIYNKILPAMLAKKSRAIAFLERSNEAVDEVLECLGLSESIQLKDFTIVHDRANNSVILFTNSFDVIKIEAVTDIIIPDLEWTHTHTEDKIINQAMSLIHGMEGNLVVASSKNSGILYSEKARFDFFSKITTLEVHPDLDLDLNDPKVRRDFLLD